MTTITFTDASGVVGVWRRDGDEITSDPAVRDILDLSLARSGVEETWRRYSEWSNGYVSSRLDDDEGSISLDGLSVQ